MVLSSDRRTAAIFFNRKDTELALSELKNAGFPITQISVVTKELENNNFTDGFGTSEFLWYQASSSGKATCGAITGSMLGAICGCLVGLGLIVVPGIGFGLAVGTTGATLAATIAGAGIGGAGGGLLENLVDSGTVFEQMGVEHDRAFEDEYLVIVNGTDDEVSRAESILKLLQNK